MAFDSRPDYSLAAAVTFLVLCLVIVPLRFWARFKRGSGYGVDDWLTVPALLMLIGCSATFITGVQLHVLGYPTPLGSDPEHPLKSKSYEFTMAEKFQWIFFQMHIVGMGFVKLSFLYFFRRIFAHNRPKSRFNIVSIICIVITVLWTITFFFWFLFTCGTHFSARWDTLETYHQNCPTDQASGFGLGLSDMITDIMVISLPIPMVLRLKMKLSRKLAVLGIFAMGGLALAASTVRFAIFTHVVALAAQNAKSKSTDEDLLITKAIYWSMIEGGLALIACCLPPLSTLAKRPALTTKSRVLNSSVWPRFRRAEVSDAPTLGITDSMLKVSQMMKEDTLQPLHVDNSNHQTSGSRSKDDIPSEDPSSSTLSSGSTVVRT